MRRVCCICTGATIVYENGARVYTGFVTNLENCAARTAPELRAAIQEATNRLQKELTAELPNYSYPVEVCTEAMPGRLSKYGQELRIGEEDCMHIHELDKQKECGSAIYGGGLLLGRTKAAEKAAAEKVNTTVWELSAREREIVEGLG